MYKQIETVMAYYAGHLAGQLDRAKGRTPEHSHSAYDVRQFSDKAEWTAYNNGYYQISSYREVAPEPKYQTTMKGEHMIHKGDTVRIKKEWQDAGDANIVFVAAEDQDGNRVRIEAQLGLPINPTSVVDVAMLETNERGHAMRYYKKEENGRLTIKAIDDQNNYSICTDDDREPSGYTNHSWGVDAGSWSEIDETQVRELGFAHICE